MKEVSPLENYASELNCMITEKLHLIYGETVPAFVSQRVKAEQSIILQRGYDKVYLIAQELVRSSLEQGQPVTARGRICCSLIAFLIGITEVDPLPPHYVCPHCKHAELEIDNLWKCGADLPDRLCPICGGQYRKSGFHMPFEIFLAAPEDEGLPEIELDFTKEYLDRAIAHKDALFSKYGCSDAEGALWRLEVSDNGCLSIFHTLQTLTGVNPQTIPLDDPDTISLFSSTEKLGYRDEPLLRPTDTGVIGFWSCCKYEELRPKQFGNLVRLFGSPCAGKLWPGNTWRSVLGGGANYGESVVFRDDILLYLRRHGVEQETAYRITEVIGEGQLEGHDMAQRWVNVMRSHGVPDRYIRPLFKIDYLSYKAQAVTSVMIDYRLMWFDLYYPLAFYCACFSNSTSAAEATVICRGIDAVKTGLQTLMDDWEQGWEWSEEKAGWVGTLKVAYELYLRGFGIMSDEFSGERTPQFLIADAKNLKIF